MNTKLALALALAVPAVASAKAPTVEQAEAVVRDLHPQTGDVKVPGTGATLHLGKDYYYLSPVEAKRVLTDVWGNPPSVGDGVLGLVLPTGKTVVDSVWGAVLTWDGSGYVTDDDAKTADYDAVLDKLREGEDANNKERRDAGYPGMHLVGWAQPPAYDPATHSVVWARDLKVDGAPADSLNYDVRLLGRGGVLSLNMLASMPDLPEVRQAAQAFGRTATFDAGQRYADFDESKGDKRAGYGLAGLVAAGVGVAVAKKLGILAIALGLGKKLIVVAAIAFAAVRRFFGRLFGRKDKGDEVM